MIKIPDAIKIPVNKFKPNALIKYFPQWVSSFAPYACAINGVSPYEIPIPNTMKTAKILIPNEHAANFTAPKCPMKTVSVIFTTM